MWEDGSNLSVKMRGVLQFCWFIVLPLFSLRMSDGAVMFTKEPDNPSYFKRGSNATLVWDYTDPQNTVTGIVWSVQVGQTLLGMLGRTGGNVAPHSEMPANYSGRVFIVGRASLVIVNLTLKDSTDFKCTLIGNPDITSTVSLIVADPPVIDRVSVASSYDEGSEVNITCLATGIPVPDVIWIRNEQEKSRGKVFAVLAYDSIVRTDDGQYTCKANNSVGSEEKQITLVVHYPATVISYSPNNTKSWIGETVKFKCVSDGIPTPNITWFKPDKNELKKVTAKENSVDVNMTVDEDFGAYKCIVDNGLSPNHTITVIVQQITEPSAPLITSSDTDIQASSLTVKWSEPTNNGGSPITAYRVVILRNGTEIKNENITDPSTTSLSFGGLDKGTQYTVKVFARNFVFEGTAGNKTLRTNYEGVPDAAVLIDVPSEVKGGELTLKWNEPPNNGAEITQYTVYKRTVNEDDTTGEWEEVAVITNPLIRQYTIYLKKDKKYDIVVIAKNMFGEGLKEEGKIERIKVVGAGHFEDPRKGSGESDGIDTAIVAGAAAAGVLLIIGVIILIVLWRRRKASHLEETSRDELGGGNIGEPDEGYASVSRAAAQSLGTDGPSAAVNYAVVDPFKKKKNRQPAVVIEYAQVDQSKKAKKNKKKKPGDLDYAELGDFRPEYPTAAATQPAAGAAASAATRLPPAYEHTEYADIGQFGIPQPDPTYANVSKKDDVVYSNVESM